MVKCLVAGGGFAGLSAAVFLAENGHQVSLIEASPKLGGRAYSFNYAKQNCVVDNGQHILMGCYNYTFQFLELINSLETIDIQPSLKIDFLARGGNHFQLDTEGVTYPFNILSALRNYEALSNSEKLSIVKLFLKIAIANPKHYLEKTTKEFLKENNQNKNTIDALWEILHVGTMNCKLEESSAAIFIRVLKEIFFTVDNSTKIVLPILGLSEVYCEHAKTYLQNKKCSISLSEKLISLKFDSRNQSIISVTTSKNTYEDFDYIILAIPPHQCKKVLEDSNIEFPIPDFDYSPILNIYLWLNTNPFSKKFYGLIDSQIHWLFNHNSFITLVTSAADKLINLSDDEILEIAVKELSEYFHEFNSSDIIDSLIIKEKRATFIPSIENTKQRDKMDNMFKNIVFAGDWTNTKFPATIEGAVKSGFIAAKCISEPQK